jgi:uncharacterized lipoprotein YmbA
MTRVAAALVLVLLNGCSILAPVPDRSRFFTLTTIPEPAPVARVGKPEPGRIYGLGPITVPAYLDRREVAVRLSPTEIGYSQLDLWAESLGTNVTSVLQQNLSMLLRPDRVVGYPYAATLPADYRVEIHVLRFEHDATGKAELAAAWSVHDVRGRRVVLAEQSAYEEAAASADPSAATAALSQALGALSTDIATALRALPTPGGTRR